MKIDYRNTETEMIKLTRGIHSVNQKPIIIVSGDTFPIYKKLGRNGLGFTWYKPKKIWWMYASSFNDNVLKALQQLGVDTSAASTDATISPTQSTFSPKSEDIKPKQELTNKTDIDDNAPSIKYYGFPVKGNIYSTTIDVKIDDVEYPMTITMDRAYRKGQRKQPIYAYTVKYKGENLGRLGEKAPGLWGMYNEDALAQEIPSKIQSRFDAKDKSKMYRAFKTMQELEKRDPALTSFLQQWYDLKYKDKEALEKLVATNISPVSISINEEGYTGDFPISIENLGDTLYFYTNVEHPLAPYHKTLGYLDIQPSIKTINELNQEIQNFIKMNQEEIKNKYLEYLKSFPYKQEEQQQSEMEMRSIVDMIVKNFVDLGNIKQELISRGFIRKKLRGEGWVVTKKATDAGYSRKNDINQFYGSIAYWLHRKHKNISSITEMMLNETVNDLTRLIKRYGHEISWREVNSFLENKIVNPLYQDLFNKRPPRSVADNIHDFYGNFGRGTQGTEIPSSSFSQTTALDNFVQFANELGSDQEIAKNNPKETYRKLSLQYHPGSTENANLPPEKQKELELIFGKLSRLYNNLPDNLKRANNWYQNTKYN